MVSTELLRRYQFFAGLNSEQIANLAELAEEVTVEAESYLFAEEEELAYLFLVLEGRIAVTLNLPEVGNRAVIASPAAKKREVTVGMVGVGEMCAWAALVPPYKAISNAKTLTPCRILTLNANELRGLFEQEPRFGYHMLVRIVQIARDHIQELHYESLAGAVENPSA